MSDSIYHMTFKSMCSDLILIFGVKTLECCHIYVTLKAYPKICKPLEVCRS